MKMQKTIDRKKLINMILTGVFAALIVVFTMISIPMPTGVPVTLQTFGIALAGFILGAKYGSLSLIVYTAIGAIGLPVFSGFQGGFGVLAGVTGGFIWGFILMALICGLGKKFNNKIASIAFGLLGLVVCHIFGIVQFSLVTGTDLFATALLVSVPYLVKDIISVVGAFLAAMVINKALENL